MAGTLIVGAAGQLGSAFVRLLGDGATGLDRAALDLTDLQRIGPTIERHEPDVVLNCAAYTAVDAAESDPATARLVNGLAVGELARACRRIGSRLVTFSTDYVFDGGKDVPYVESDPPAPINTYGRTKREGEERALDEDPTALVIRTSWLMSSTHRSFASVILDRLADGTVKVVDDQRGHPTVVDDLARATVIAVEAGAAGILHLTNDGTASWFDVARDIARFADLDPRGVVACTTAEFPTVAPRPANSVLDSERRGALGIPMPPDYRESLAGVVRALRSRDPESR